MVMLHWFITSYVMIKYNFIIRLSSSDVTLSVGISLGVRRNTQQIAVLPYDLSCWNSRLSGIGYICSDSSARMPAQDRAVAGVVGNSISASDALYIDIDVGTVDQILQN